MKKILLFLLMVLPILLIFTYFFWLYEAKYFVGRASETKSVFSIDNSYIFISPLRAKASQDNNEKIRVTIFVLNNQGLGVLGRSVNLELSPFIKIEAIQAITDDYGKAVFDVSSSKIGEYYLGITVDGTDLKQKAHLTFN